MNKKLSVNKCQDKNLTLNYFISSSKKESYIYNILSVKRYGGTLSHQKRGHPREWGGLFLDTYVLKVASAVKLALYNHAKCQICFLTLN